MRISRSYGSHLPILSKIVESTTGPILELGVGINSTPFLHWACFPTRRKLVSYESSEKYVRYLSTYRSDFHEINLLESWDKLPVMEFWEIVLVDHEPHERRSIETVRLANNAKYLILHDSEPEHDNLYHYSDAYPHFKFRYDYKNAFPNTTILSNFVDVTKLFNG